MGRNTICIVQYVWCAPCINRHRTAVDSLPLQLRGAVTVGGTIAGGSVFGSGLLRALWYIIGQLYDVLSWCRGSRCVPKLPCTASSLLFRRQSPCSCDSKHADCRGDGPDCMWYPWTTQLQSPKHLCHSVNATLHHCTESKVAGSVL